MRTLAYGWHLFKVLKLSAKEYEPDKFSVLRKLSETADFQKQKIEERTNNANN